MSAVKNVGRLFSKQSALFICDIQEKFRPNIKHFDGIVEITSRMVKAAHVFDIPVIVSAQYPEKLGPVASGLELNKYGIKTFNKTKFSMMTPEICELMKTKYFEVKSIILCGFAAHSCVQATALDAIFNGYDVHVVADACSSEQKIDRLFAFERMKQAGVYVTTYESILL